MRNEQSNPQIVRRVGIDLGGNLILSHGPRLLPDREYRMQAEFTDEKLYEQFVKSFERMAANTPRRSAFIKGDEQ